jgi:hypothetical protein
LEEQDGRIVEETEKLIGRVEGGQDGFGKLDGGAFFLESAKGAEGDEGL